MVNTSTDSSFESSTGGPFVSSMNAPTINMMMPSEPMLIPGGIKLKGGSNYDVWSQFVTMFIVGRGKKGFITGTNKQPDVGDITYDKWVMDDAIVKGWLINSMETDVMMLFIRLPTSKAVWDAASRTFFEGADKSIIYDLHERKCPRSKGEANCNLLFRSEVSLAGT